MKSQWFHDRYKYNYNPTLRKRKNGSGNLSGLNAEKGPRSRQGSVAQNFPKIWGSGAGELMEPRLPGINGAEACFW